MKVGQYLLRQVIAHCTAKSDWQASRLVLGNWLSIAAIFAVVATWTNPFSLVAAVLPVARRQLGLFMASVLCCRLTAHPAHSKRQNALEGVPEFRGCCMLLRYVAAV